MNTIKNIIQWFNMNLGNIIVLTIIIIAVVMAIKKLIKTNKTGCQGECMGCSAAHFCNHNANNHANAIVDDYHRIYPKN